MFFFYWCEWHRGLIIASANLEI